MATFALPNWTEILMARLDERQKKKKYVPKYMKPKVMHWKMSQFPFRCPVCHDKSMFRDHAQDCLDKCWEELTSKIFDIIKEKEKEPKEVSSWQWETENHRDYCGIVLYDNGNLKYVKSFGKFEFISIDELKRIMPQMKYIWQKGRFELPEELKQYASLSTRKSGPSISPVQLIKEGLD